MKKKLLGVLMLSTVVQVCASDWSEVVEARESKSYVNDEKILRNGHYAEVWALIDFYEIREVSGKKYLSVKHLELFDCLNRTAQTKRLIFYSDNMAKGNVVFSLSYSNPKTEYVVRSSAFEGVFDYACRPSQLTPEFNKE